MKAIEGCNCPICRDIRVLEQLHRVGDDWDSRQLGESGRINTGVVRQSVWSRLRGWLRRIV